MTSPLVPGNWRPPKRSTLGALAVWCLTVHACGPSFEAIQEGDLRFAHCDRLDLDPNIAPSHRLHCWREWRRVYTYAQTRDRVEYAQRRIAEVVGGDTKPSFDLPSGTLHAAASPQTPALEAQVATETPPRAAPAEPDCQERCKLARASCSVGCETKATGCQSCEPQFTTCLLDCGPPSP